MENIKIIQSEERDGSIIEHIIIDRGNGEFTSMLKSTWDELEAAKEAQSLQSMNTRKEDNANHR